MQVFSKISVYNYKTIVIIKLWLFQQPIKNALLFSSFFTFVNSLCLLWYSEPQVDFVQECYLIFNNRELLYQICNFNFKFFPFLLNFVASSCREKSRAFDRKMPRRAFGDYVFQKMSSSGATTSNLRTRLGPISATYTASPVLKQIVLRHLKKKRLDRLLRNYVKNIAVGLANKPTGPLCSAF